MVKYELVRGGGRRAFPQLALPRGVRVKVRDTLDPSFRRRDQKGTGHAKFGERAGGYPRLQDQIHKSDAGRSPAGAVVTVPPTF